MAAAAVTASAQPGPFAWASTNLHGPAVLSCSCIPWIVSTTAGLTIFASSEAGGQTAVAAAQ